MTWRRGVTLIELLVLQLVVAAMVLGAMLAASRAHDHGLLFKLLAGLLGALGGLLTVAGAFFLLTLPGWLWGAARRVFFQPAETLCTCRTAPAPPHLLPSSPVASRALEQSRCLRQWPAYAGVLALESPFEGEVQARVTAERRELAGELRQARGRKPVLRYTHWVKLPRDLQAVLRSGLPPRLCLVWALSCAERALGVFEGEFHQDTRPRQALGAALMVLRDGDAQAAELCRTVATQGWRVPEDQGCRVLHRSWQDRLWQRRSPGQEASSALIGAARAVANYAEPAGLFAVYFAGDIANAYCTPQARCDWAQPCWGAEEVAHHAALAAPDPEAELQWQREQLARLILAWPYWDEDRAEWHRRLEQEWSPRVLGLQGLPFPAEGYATLMREQLAPWAPGQVGPAGGP